MSNPVLRIVFLVEFVAAFALPCTLLMAGTIFAVPLTILRVFEGGPDIMDAILLIVVAGGYVGMLGALMQGNSILYGQKHALDGRAFLYTLIGCLTNAFFIWMWGEAEEDLADPLSWLVILAPVSDGHTDDFNEQATIVCAI